MKKYLVILAAVFCMGSLLTGCGTKEDQADTAETQDADSDQLVAPSLEKVKLDKVVTLGEYIGIEVEKTIEAVTDEEILSELNYVLNSYPEEISEGVAETGDVLDIAFVGKVDGNEFEGGSSESYSVTIGAGSNIDGFEDGLVGTTVGQNLELNLKFPDDYSEELGGKDVVFNITVNSIKRPLTEATDEWAAANTEYTTVDEYKAQIRKDLETSKEENAEETVKTTAWQAVLDNAVINEYPEEVVEYGVKIYKSQFETYAAYSGVTVEEFVESQGMTAEQYEEQSKTYGNSVAAQILVANAIAEKENLKTGDEEYKTILQEYLDSYEMTEEEFFEQNNKANVDQTILLDRVNNLIIKNANIKVVNSTESSETAK